MEFLHPQIHRKTKRNTHLTATRPSPVRPHQIGPDPVRPHLTNPIPVNNIRRVMRFYLLLVVPVVHTRAADECSITIGSMYRDGCLDNFRTPIHNAVNMTNGGEGFRLYTGMCTLDCMRWRMAMVTVVDAAFLSASLARRYVSQGRSRHCTRKGLHPYLGANRCAALVQGWWWCRWSACSRGSTASLGWGHTAANWMQRSTAHHQSHA